VTKRIKVELAGVVIIAVFGIVSQMRVWKLVNEHRVKSAAQQLEKQQDQDREEEALGRKIEDNLQTERAQWEATYGGKSVQDSSIRSSFISPKGSTSIRETETYGNDSMEMVNLSKSGVRRSTNTDTPSGTTVTVSMLNDDIQHIDDQGNPMLYGPIEPIGGSEAGEKAPANATDSSPSNVTSPTITRRTSLRLSAPPPPPAIVPLPFTIPKESDARDDEEDNASVSAVPETDQKVDLDCGPISKRISDMSTMRQRISRNISESQDALVNVPHVEADRASSVAATLDDDHDDISLRQLSPHSPIMDGKHAEYNDLTTADAKDFAPLLPNVRRSLATSTDPKPDEPQRSLLSIPGRESTHSCLAVRVAVKANNPNRQNWTRL